MSWQDISTAPKDGTKILLFQGLTGVTVGSWDERFREWGDNVSLIPRCTHWMPLPPPPTDFFGPR